MSLLSSSRTALRGPLRLVLFCVVGTCPVVALAAQVPEALRGQEGDFDRQAVDSLDFILSLSLTQEQARAILRQYEEACRRYLDYYNDLAEIQPLEIEAYTAFLEEDRLNQGFTPEVERRTARIHHRALALRETVSADLNSLAEGVWDVLTPDQRQIAADYKPNRKAVFDRFASSKERRRAARRAERRARRTGLRPQGDDPQLKSARKELETINKATHVRPDAIAKYLLRPAAAEPLCQLADVRAPQVVREAVDCRRSGTRDYPRARGEQDEQTLHELRKEINNWNLANGMYFSREQIEQLVYLADEAERFKSTQRQAKPKDKLPRKDFNAEIVKLELAAEAVLRPGQLEVMETYKPCLLPPKNLKDPVRVGQASDGARLARWLERARGKPQRRVERMIERLIEREIAHLGPMDDATTEQRRNLLRETVRQASGMSDVEFALNKDDLADAIQPQDRKDELIADIDAMRRKRVQPGRTAQFLLNRGFAEVLKVRYEQLSNEAPVTRRE